MKLLWNKTPDGRRFIHTAQIIGDWQWCVTQFDNQYTLRIQPENNGSPLEFYETLKQAKAAAKRMTLDRTWTRLASDRNAALIALHGTTDDGPSDDAESFKVGVLPVLDASDIDFSGPPKAIDGDHLHARIATRGGTYGTVAGVPDGSTLEQVDRMSYSNHVRATFKLPEPDADFNTHVVKVLPGTVNDIDFSGPPKAIDASVAALQNKVKALGGMFRENLGRGTMWPTGTLARSIGEVLQEVEKAKQMLREKSGFTIIAPWAVRGPTISDLIRQGHLPNPDTIGRVWAWPRSGQFVHFDIEHARIVANYKRTHAKQTGNARILVSRNKREGRYTLNAYGSTRVGWIGGNPHVNVRGAA